MRLLLVADTHLPKRARQLPTQVWAEVDAADVVVHAGDWVDVSLLDELEERASRLVGVHGNNDHGDLRRRLPEVAYADLGGVRMGGGPRDRAGRRTRGTLQHTLPGP